MNAPVPTSDSGGSHTPAAARRVLAAFGRFWAGIGVLAYRELLSLFVTPVAYVVGTLFLFLQGWNFALLLQVLNDPLAAPGPVMQYYFGGSFFIFWLPVLFTCAAISMRLVAEERKLGTFEALLTAPVRPPQIVLGKFIGGWSFFALLWAPTGVFYILLKQAGADPDPGPIAAAYLGTALVGASFIAIGLWMSSLSRSQLGAAISTFVACMVWVLAGLLVDQIDNAIVRTVLERTSLLAMMQEVAQGIVDSGWIGVHAAVIVVALWAANVAIDPRRRVQSWLSFAFVAIAAVHGAWFTVRHHERLDWTASRVYSLSPRARAVLESIDRPIDVRVVVPATLGGGRPNPLAQELREVLRRMSAVTGQLRVQVLDPDRDRQQAEQWVASFGLGGRTLADGVVLIRSGQGTTLRKAHLLPSDLVVYATGPEVQLTGPRVQEFRGEEAILRAIVGVLDPDRTTVCYTQGHGEPRFDNLEPFSGFAHLGDLFRDAGMKLEQADLDAADGLRGCDVLLIAGPSSPFGRSHAAAIERYAEGGGDVIVLAGAVVVPDGDALVQNGLESWLASYGLALGDRIVLDPHNMPGARPLLAFTLHEGWGDHPASRSLIGRPLSFVLARELELHPLEGVDPVSLMEVGSDAWAEADIARVRAGDPVAFDDGRDRAGPIPVAAASERGGSRVVVVASDQLAVNAYLRPDMVYDYNRDFLLNIAGWVSEKDALLGIRPRPREHVKLVLLPGQLRRMTWVCLLGLPGFAIGLGILVLWRRRR